jgi:hypothetical protein
MLKVEKSGLPIVRAHNFYGLREMQEIVAGSSVSDHHVAI